MVKTKKATKIQHTEHSPVTIEDIDQLYELYRPLIENTLVSEPSSSLEYIFSFQCGPLLTKHQLQSENPSSSEIRVTDRSNNSKRIRPANLQDSTTYNELRKTLLSFFDECETFDLRPSMRTFCGYFCMQRGIEIKYASMRNHQPFRDLWTTSQTDWEKKVKK